MSTRYTTSLSRDNVTNFINAFAFSESKGTPFTAFVTIDWSLTQGWSEAVHQERQSKFISRMNRWLRKHSTVPCYVWVLEAARKRSVSDLLTRHQVHQHLAVHVPKRLFVDFIRKFNSFIPGHSGNPYIVHFERDHETDPPKYYFHFNQRLGGVLYRLKGINHALTFNAPSGRENLAAHLGIQHRGVQGVVLSKRSGVSHSLGLRQRLRAGWDEATSPDALAALLQPIPKRPSRSGQSAHQDSGLLVAA